MIKDIEKAYAALLDRKFQEELFKDLHLEKTGGAWQALCPFHKDERPTFLIHPDKPEYFCFACSSSGDWIDYLIKSHSLTFKEALEIISHNSGVTIHYSENEWKQDLRKSRFLEIALSFFKAELWSGSAGYEYLHERGYTNDELEAMNLGFCPSKAETAEYLESAGGLISENMDLLKFDLLEKFPIIIPWRDISGRLAGLIGRNIEGSGSDAYRPLTDIEGLNSTPFMMYKARGNSELVITQGYFDTLLANLVGVNAVGVGEAGLREEQLETLAGYGSKKFVLCLKSQEAQETSYRLLKNKGLDAVILKLPEQFQDADDYIRGSCIHKFAGLVQHAKNI